MNQSKTEQVLPIIIPSLEPDERLIELLRDLQQAELTPIVLVDDGSGEAYRHYFVRAKEEFGCTVLRHEVNKGKGRALKDAFRFCLQQWPQMVGCITADSDGQHSVACIRKCKTALLEDPDCLILGVRDFNGADVPAKSAFGNRITRKICKYLCGLDVSDTQTGLRAIPKDFMAYLLDVEGERFEFETQMLIASKDFCNIKEVGIETIYDSKENHSTHFDPVRDSIRIYKIFGKIFGRYLFSSLSASIVDLVLFTIFCWILKRTNLPGLHYIAVATIGARIISAVYNYLINYKFVFKSRSTHARSGTRYFLLAVVQMLCSAALVTGAATLLPAVPEAVEKAVVDTCLFFVSYHIQQKYVYR